VSIRAGDFLYLILLVFDRWTDGKGIVLVIRMAMYTLLTASAYNESICPEVKAVLRRRRGLLMPTAPYKIVYLSSGIIVEVLFDNFIDDFHTA
jgi:hypothetical protein